MTKHLYKLIAETPKGERTFYNWAPDEETSRNAFALGFPYTLAEVVRIL